MAAGPIGRKDCVNGRAAMRSQRSMPDAPNPDGRSRQRSDDSVAGFDDDLLRNIRSAFHRPAPRERFPGFTLSLASATSFIPSSAPLTKPSSAPRVAVSTVTTGLAAVTATAEMTGPIKPTRASTETNVSQGGSSSCAKNGGADKNVDNLKEVVHVLCNGQAISGTTIGCLAADFSS